MIKTISFASSLLLVLGSTSAEDCPSTWKCHRTKNGPPTLDGDLNDWADVEGGIDSSLQLYTGPKYDLGSGNFKCQFDDNNIYLALKIPGMYKFNATDDHHCAAVSTMTKVGVDATYYNMGGCPDAPKGGDCNDEVINMCEKNLVDVGCHWEISGTEQGKAYGVDSVDDLGTTKAGDSFTGNDLIANKDDEFAVSAYCRKDDTDGELAGNEWAGAWTHTNSNEGEMGDYIFELARTLTTPSTKTDAQMKAGETYEFGVAFWDPYESAEGWTKPNHYVTGCGENWIDLELVEKESGAIHRSGTVFVSASLAMLFMLI